MLPAEQGDALFIEYGSARDPHRVLIDAGVRKSSALVRARNLTHFVFVFVASALLFRLMSCPWARS